jgi:hypothetical protein
MIENNMIDTTVNSIIANQENKIDYYIPRIGDSVTSPGATTTITVPTVPIWVTPPTLVGAPPIVTTTGANTWIYDSAKDNNTEDDTKDTLYIENSDDFFVRFSEGFIADGEFLFEMKEKTFFIKYTTKKAIYVMERPVKYIVEFIMKFGTKSKIYDNIYDELEDILTPTP